MKPKFAIAFVGALLSIFPLGSSEAASLEEFYRGKQIELISSSDAGSSFDAYARAIAPFMTKYLPGNPIIVVKNMPGGGHIRATNYLYSVAPNDGYTIGLSSQLMVAASVLKHKPALKADFTKFVFIGSLDKPDHVCLARSDAPAKSGDDLFSTELLVGGGGAGSGATAIATFVNKALGLKLKIIEGYKGNNEIFLAIDRHEIEGACVTISSARLSKSEALKDGSMRVLFNMREQPIPETGAPSIFSLVRDPDDIEMLRFYARMTTQVGRPILAPPGTPRDKVDALRKAFEASIRDPEFIANVTAQKLDPTGASASELEEILDQLLATPPTTLQRAVELGAF